jgi:hypothetical protein
LRSASNTANGNVTATLAKDQAVARKMKETLRVHPVKKNGQWCVRLHAPQPMLGLATRAPQLLH